MAKTLSLAELKAENIANESEQEEVKPVEDEFVEVKEEIEEEVEDKAEAEPEAEPEDEPEDDKAVEKLEDWQKSEDDVSEDGKKTGFVPNAGAAKLRRKLRDSKLEGKTREAELEAEIERLKVSSTPAATEEQLAPRPTLENYGFDEDKHNLALDEWYDKRTDVRINSHTDQLQQQRLRDAQQQQTAKRTDDAVNRHLESAATLIADGKIKEDSWLKGDIKIREALELATPGFGDAIADQFITLLDSNGPGSDKAWYYVGQNPQALAELKDKVSNDPTGASAIMYLAGIQNKATQPIRKKRSDAPKPSAKLKGDVPAKAATKAEKQYAKSTDLQERISLKLAAKRRGVDVSTW